MAMDSNSYKDLKVSRGFNYHYYVATAREKSKQNLVFIHGFGVASQDWRHQVRFFQELGYGIIAPDSLGYGGSSIIRDPQQLKLSLIAQDIVEILQHENIQSAIFVGQGGGSPIISRVAQLYPEKVTAAAFLAIPYAATPSPFDLKQVLKIQKDTFGYELFGYWEFLAMDPDAPVIAISNFEAFFNLIYPDDPKSWISLFGPSGAMKGYLLAGPDAVLPSPSWFSAEEKRLQYTTLQAFDLSGPFTYYKAYLENVQSEDGQQSVPLDRYRLSKPVFYGYGTEDYISLPAIGKQAVQSFCDGEKLTIREFKANHWMHLQVPDDVNRTLLDWLQGL
ncbi:epoxide hydrolase [Moniliophthora roreri]|uniref:AB hydrolase-1 domain-containing protein n=1 Tax=Moniliophthora roreri TaxID=221103 RepID=A0A0W0F2L9_MONRR|nr:epoxide hydrolase [Moniliophthora roreri]